MTYGQSHGGRNQKYTTTAQQDALFNEEDANPKPAGPCGIARGPGTSRSPFSCGVSGACIQIVRRHERRSRCSLAPGLLISERSAFALRHRSG